MTKEPNRRADAAATWTAAAETASLTPRTDRATPGPGGEGDRIPQRLGSVRLVRPLGRGGMGVVWLGRDEMLERDAAVKFLLHAEASASDPDFAAFLQGARAAAKVRHPGLTTLFHADLFEGRPYLVMEYVDGPALNQALRQGGPLSLPVVLAALQAVCDAVGELHEQAIVHRDIKPGNVLLDMQGRVFVTDFGLACARPTESTGASAAAIAGTPAYMAPEVFDGVVSPRGDVYALGVTSYELLTGELPFTGSLAQLREQHRSGAPPLERLAARGVSAEVVEAIGRAMHKDAMFRYKTARHFLRALHEACPDAATWTRGAAELAALAARALASAGDKPATGQTPRLGSSYYDLLAARADERRRQQGKPAADEPTVPPDRPGPAPTLQADVPCVHCGYDLRTHAPDALCPECGAPVAHSLRGDLLSAADPLWLARVCRGHGCLMLGGLLPFLYWIAVMIAEGGAAAGLVGAGFAAAWFDQGLTATLLAGTVLVLVGTLGITTPDPRLALTEQPRALRRVTRATAAAAVVLVVVRAGISLLAAAPWQRQVLGLAAIFVCLAAIGAASWYLAYLAGRMPDRALARKTRAVVMATTLFAVPLMARVVAELYLFQGQTLPGWLDSLGNVSVLGALIALVWLLTVWSRYRAPLRRFLAEARANTPATGA